MEINFQSSILQGIFHQIQPTFPKFKKIKREYHYLDPAGIELLESMIELNPQKRINIHDAKKHRYFKTKWSYRFMRTTLLYITWKNLEETFFSYAHSTSSSDDPKESCLRRKGPYHTAVEEISAHQRSNDW